MSDEVREVEIRIQANQAIRELGRVAVSMDNVGNLAGRSDADLRRVERRMDSWAASTRQANATIVAMRAALAASKAETAAAERTTAKMATTMERSAAAHDKTKAALLTATAALKQMRKESTQLRTENEALVKKIERLENALTDTRVEFDAYKASINAADKGLLRFGASATQTLTRLESLEQQMNAMNGKSLSMLNLPTALAGTNPAAFARNPDVNAIRNMTTASLAQITQAYTVMGRTLQQEVERELAGRFAQRGFGMNAQQLEFSNALRYQLYDLVGVFGTVGVAATGLSVAFLGVGIAWEKNFANVERTSQLTGTAVENLRQEFLDLQSIIPVSSEELATIGTLGAQMGVAASNLANFTEITAKFSATAGISVDESATALSRLDELLPDVEGNYNRLASAILKTGVNAVATEQQIVRGTNQIASMGQIAGLTTPEVVALASAMSSLGFSPELQRSIITSSFSKIMLATTEVTEKTEAYGKVLGMTGKQFQEAWRSDALGTYRDLLVEIGNRGDAVAILSDLGLASQRLTPNLLKLGQNANVLDQALKDTRLGWLQQTELTRQYGVISRTVAARIQVLSQSWEALLVTLSDSESVIGPVVDLITDIVRGLRDLADNPVARQMVSVISVIGLLTGVLGIGLSAVALFTAGWIAMANATIGLNVVLAQNTVEEEVNTGAKVRNTAATGALTTATNTNTGATIANTTAVRGQAVSMINLSSNILGALPSILRWGTAIAGVTAGVLAVIAVASEAGNIVLDVQKKFEGVETVGENIEFDIKRIKEFRDAMDSLKSSRDNGTMYEEQPWIVRYFENLGIWDNPITEKWLNDPAWDDLEKQILGLGSVEAQYAAVNQAADDLGITQDELVKQMPGLSSALATGAKEAKIQADAIEQLATAQEIWAAILGGTTVEMGKFNEALSSGASSFFDYTTMIQEAWEGMRIENPETGEMELNPDFDPGAAWSQFTTGLQTKVTDYQAFLDGLSTLTQRGGLNLASQFAAMGPESMSALTEALKMSPTQLAEVEGNMRLAAFYASEEFAQAFTESNAILAAVMEATGDPAMVAAVSDMITKMLKPGQKLTVNDIVAIEELIGVRLPVGIDPELDPQALIEAQTIASATPITLQTDLDFTAADESLYGWKVMDPEGRTLIMGVDPNTEQGSEIINAWLADEKRKKVTVSADVATAVASAKMREWRLNNSVLSVDVRPNFSNPSMGGGRNVYANVRKDGGLLDGTGTFRSLPAFATGGGYGTFSGPGTGTSDSILARVSNGEYIHTARAVRYYGKDFFDDLNRMRIPRFATGGMIGGAPAAGGAGTVVNATVIQNYPTTQDPIRKLKEDAESVIAGIWT